MLRFTHLRGRRAPSVEHFPGPRVRIGSDAGSDLSFAAGVDLGVMPQHAEIHWDRGAYWVVDLGTPAGTYINQLRVGRQALRHGDVLCLGGRGGPELRVELIPDGHAPGMPDAEGRVDIETAQRLVHDAVIRQTSQPDRSAAIV
ncbi:MAG: FHA domain-containing protein, partial [Minicystis sp.]